MTTPTATLRRHAARLLSVRLVFKPARAHFFCFVFLLFFCFALFLLVRKKSERQFLVPRPAATETYRNRPAGNLVFVAIVFLCRGAALSRCRRRRRAAVHFEVRSVRLARCVLFASRVCISGAGYLVLRSACSWLRRFHAANFARAKAAGQFPTALR